jgi:Putative Ig domain
VLAAVASLALAAVPARAGLAHVTLFGDSVPVSLNWQPVLAVVSQGIDLDMQAIECRRIEDAGCSPGGQPSSVMQVINDLSDDPGPTVVMVLGYNESEGYWLKSVDDVLHKLEADGVKHVFWLTMREVDHSYVRMNDALVPFTQRYPELTILDWNAYSRSHPDWFQGDGLHLQADGAFAMASFIHSALVNAGIAQPPPAAATSVPTTTSVATRLAPVRIASRALPVATRNQPYRALLAARGGRPPYRWRRTGPLPRGLHLASDGLVSGIPRLRRGTFELPVNVTDAAGAHAAGRVSVRVS